jgi:hypothetical protein
MTIRPDFRRKPRSSSGIAAESHHPRRILVVAAALFFAFARLFRHELRRDRPPSLACAERELRRDRLAIIKERDM